METNLRQERSTRRRRRRAQRWRERELSHVAIHPIEGVRPPIIPQHTIT